MTEASSSQQTTPAADLTRLLSERYSTVRAQRPGEGRRKWRLRVAEEFWAMSPAQRAEYAAKPPLASAQAEASEFSKDDDPLDDISADAPGIGIVLRTDYSNEEAWQAFYKRLQDSEKELASDAAPMVVENDAAEGVGDVAMDIEDESEMSEEETSAVFYVVNDPARQGLFSNISNLTALRLLNDVEIRKAPTPPPKTVRIKPPNRLVDHDGWQEVYVGKMVWIYDAKSNSDQCVRLVSQHSAMYGTATADSWRARVSHICELQVGMASGAMTIDFGGIDRWDYPERVRNMQEASTPLS